MTHHCTFHSALLEQAGVTASAYSYTPRFVHEFFTSVFENKKSDEVVIVSGATTFEVTSIDEVMKRWDELHLDHSAVHIYRMSESRWREIKPSLRQQEEHEQHTASE